MNYYSPQPMTFKFNHNKPSDTDFIGYDVPEKNYTLFRDLGIKDATNGKFIAVITKANLPPAPCNDWHYHKVDFHILYMLKGWAKFMYNDKITLVETGDCIVQPDGMVHVLFDYSPDMEYLEVISPSDPGHYEVAEPCEVPKPIGWD